MTLSLIPAYNLKAVLKETGIKPDVLRAWERRYGVPMPQRTEGGHRLYSEHDIEIIKWLIARQADGLSISHAVDMWKEKSAQGQDPLALVAHTAVQVSPPVRPLEFVAASPAMTGMDELRSRWLSACTNFNENAAEQALNQAFALYPVESVCSEVLQRGLVEIGSLWYQGRASVQQEHFASALAARRLDALLMASPAPTRLQTIIVGCPANEWHTFTPLLMALLIRRRGYNVIYLGANIPSAHFVEAFQSVNASLVVLAAQQLNTAASLQQPADLITRQGGMVAYGGRIFTLHPDLARHIAGYYLGGRLDGALEIIENLLAARPAAPQVIAAPEEYKLALKAYLSQRAQLEVSVEQQLAAKNLGSNYFKDAHKYFGDNIIAALNLGSMDYLDGEIAWLEVMFKEHNLPGDLLHDYLESYFAAVNQHLAGRVPPLAGWLENQINLRKKIAS